jgi:uncharacterized membrane protein
LGQLDRRALPRSTAAFAQTKADIAQPVGKTSERVVLDWYRWIVAGLALLALGLRWSYFHQSLFEDELFLYFDVHGHSLSHVFSAVHDTEKTPPLGFILGWLFARGSNAPVLVRLPSLVASVASVPLIYLLGRRTAGQAAGIVAALWFALDPFAIFYGTQARAYSLVAALVVLSTLSLLAALEERTPRWWVCYAVAAVAAVYTHYIAVLVLVPQAAWALWINRGTWRQQLVANTAVVVAWLPWLPSFLVQARHSETEAKGLAALAPFTFSRFVKTTFAAVAGHPFADLHSIPGRVPALTILGVLLVGLALALVRGFPQRSGRFTATVSTPFGLVLLLAVTPPLVLGLYSLRPHKTFFVIRNLSVALPYALLVIGWLLTSARRSAALALPVAAIVALSIGTAKALSPDHQRPDVRRLARYIESRAPSKAVAVEVDYPFVGPPAEGMLVYLRHPGIMYRPYWALGNSFWQDQARNHTTLFIASPRIRALLRLFSPPPQYVSRYRLASERTTRGIVPLVVREYVWRSG